MKTFTLRSQFNLIGFTNFTNPITSSRLGNSIPIKQLTKERSETGSLTPIKTNSHLKNLTNPSTIPSKPNIPKKQGLYPKKPNSIILNQDFHEVSPNGYLRFMVVGAVSVGFVMFFMGLDEEKALALGPEGPLVEEFWDNVRRYALYALTVSTGALYTILLPIVELLKNPISAVLIVLIFGGSIYLVSQVLSAMVGVTDFSYDYGY